MKRSKSLPIAVICFACYLILCSCGEEEKGFTLDDCPVVARHEIIGTDTLVVCDLSLVGSDTLDIPLSPFFSEFDILHLESTDEALTDASTNRVMVSENYVGIYSYYLSNYKFYNREGKYLHTTASLGQGPDDITFFLMDSYVDEKNKRLYWIDQNATKLKVFGIDGKPQKPIPLAYWVQRGRFKIDVENETLFVMQMSYFNTTVSLIWVQDFDGNIISEMPFSMFTNVEESVISEAFNTPALDFTFHHWKAATPDTLYHYLPESNRLQPVFTVNFGDNTVRHQYLELKDYYIVHMLVGVNFLGADRPRLPILLVDKKTLRGTYVRFKYDMLGNIDGQNWLTFDRGYCVSNMYPYMLKEQLENALAQPLLSAGMKEKLTELNNSISEEDNNILLIGKLK
ncbi:MAG: 6-bladed beta-propeller [Tannerellaceae bacterium]|jgi:hypothetical protein|nr:6-bladed beta-propeller [Tannerellaceae bacterium]